MIRTTKSKKRNAIVALMLAIALTITGALAFLTAKDSATNKFTVGNVKITLTEPKWDAANPSGTLENIVAGQVIEKDPTINNVGKNSAYVYMLIEIPKVYQTDIVSKDANGNETIETVMHHPLFSFKANSGWSLVDSKVGTDVDAYDYYLYGHDAPLAPTESSTLFNEVTFANITSDFVNAITGNNIVDINIKATAYGIQSDFYNKEAGENASAATAWNLYAKQNDWKWPVNTYEGVSALNYFNEDNELVNSDYYYEGAPVAMYFAPSLAKEGYSFDWVDTGTNEVAYSGMAMPAHDVDLTASYTPYDESVNASDYFNYIIHGNEIEGYSATLYSADEAASTYPTAPTTVRVPAYINVTGNGTIGSPVEEAQSYKTYTPEFATDANISADLASKVWYGTDAQAINGTVSVPVTEIYHFDYDEISMDTYFDFGDDDLWSDIEPMLEPIGFQKFASSLAQKVILPDTIVEVGDCSFGDIRHSATRNGTNVIESIRLSYALKEIPDYAFAECQKLTEFIIPNSVMGIGDRAFFGCNQLTELNIPKNISYIGDYAFSGLVGHGGVSAEFEWNYAPAGLTSVTFEEPATINDIGEGAFAHCSGLTNITIPKFVTHIGKNAFYKTGLYNDTSKWQNGALIVDNCLLEGSASDIKEGIEVVADYYLSDFTASNSPFKDDGRQTSYKVSGELRLPKSLRGISANGIPYCTGISVAEGNQYLTVVDNVLYSKDKSTLIFYLPAKTETSFNIPATVSTVGQNAFTYSKNLENVSMADSVTEIKQGAFADCGKLKSVCLSAGITEISRKVFEGSSGITNLQIPVSVKKISIDNAINSVNWSAIHYLGTPEQMLEVEGFIFDGYVANYGTNDVCYVRPAYGPADSVIGSYRSTSAYGAFYPNLHKFVYFGTGDISDRHEKYENNDYRTYFPFDEYADEINTVVIGSGITGLGKRAFYGFNYVTKVEGGENVVTVADGAFENSSLTDAVDESGVFYLANTLYRVSPNYSGAFIVKDGTTRIYNKAFENCTKITSVTMPDSVVTIGEMAFNSCLSLQDVVLSKNIKTLPDMAFFSCLSLKNINLPDGLTSIGSQCFESCSCLAEFHIPATVTQIAEDALLDASIRNNIDEELSGMTEEDIVEFCNESGVTRDWFNNWSSSIPSEMIICSGSNTAYAKTYADAKGYTFNVCQH